MAWGGLKEKLKEREALEEGIFSMAAKTTNKNSVKKKKEKEMSNTGGPSKLFLHTNELTDRLANKESD